MKKRIGSKLYDTEKSELIAETVMGDVYRKRTREREWFLVSGDHVIPLTDAEARAMLGENAYPERKIDTDSIMIRVDRETHAVIARKAKADGLSITAEMRQIVKNMV